MQMRDVTRVVREFNGYLRVLRECFFASKKNITRDGYSLNLIIHRIHRVCAIFSLVKRFSNFDLPKEIF